MFATLPESAARRQKRTGGLLASAALHAALIGLAIYATGFSEPAPLTPPRTHEGVVFLPPPPPRLPAPSTGAPPTGEASRLPTPAAPIIAPLEVPDVIIPQTGPEPSVEREMFASSRALATAIGGAPGGIASPRPGDAWAAPSVDRQVVPRADNPAPRYPALLQSAGVEGAVHMRFIVDTLGRVERTSVVALSAAHPLFEAAVRESLQRARFEPAEVAGRRVRQLVEQVFQFETVRRRD